MRKTTVYLNDDDAEALRELAVTTGVSQAELIRAAIRETVARRPGRRFRSLGLGEGAGADARSWNATDLYKKAFGER
jgi:hypothetical protein